MLELPTDLNLTDVPVTLVTGPSGSGKTSALPLLSATIDDHPIISAPTAHRDRPLIDAWDAPPDKIIRWLTAAGLSDPWTWARTYQQLSTGQQARFAALDLILARGDLTIIDEFLVGIDQLTARATAWAIGKLARDTGRQIIVATTNEAIARDLRPDLIIRCHWAPSPDIIWATGYPPTCSALDSIDYAAGDRRDWARLKHLHYAAGDPATIHSVHVLRHRQHTDPLAVAVLSWPDLHSAARNLATDDRYANPTSRPTAKLLNREVLRLSRIVVTPELRGCGLASTLINHIAATVPVRYLECSTAMGRYAGFLRQLGWREVPQTSHPVEAALYDLAARLRPPAHAALAADELEQWAATLSVRDARRVRRAVWYYYHHFVLHRRTRKAVPRKIPGPSNPHWPEAWEVAARRLHTRPSYWVLGPLRPPTDQEEPQCPTTCPPSP